jgi:glycosyltransferase involved in cell wall biosynthesis
VSRYEARLVKRQFGSNSIVIQNGVAEDTFQYNWNPPSDGLVLTYAGRIERYKRVHILIEAASILLRRKHEVTVRIIGDGPELSNLLALAIRLGVKVQHFHFLKRREYLELLSTSSFFVNPSQYEAFSIVVAEAKTIGLPIVVSFPWGEIFKDLPNVSLVNGNSPHEIADAVSKIVDLRREESRSFISWNEVTDRLVREVYIPSLTRS